ncbi:M4 family metallopeptidase [Dyadobacter aurulentus]|uniref:M4 family metallopeptidase n=1 Tax=Dyadobacter sp. UC 10 TaxID=2605428 RepID=UPI001788CF44|nr:M4 family metallopeptidase [Dyadobacter sp. UC 10]
MADSLVAQTLFYQPKQFGNAGPNGILGNLYNAVPRKINNVPIVLYGDQSVYATPFLPYIETEFDNSKPTKLFGPHYTTHIAIASPKDPSLGLYAPVQVIWEDFNAHKFGAVAFPVPYGNDKDSYAGAVKIYEGLNQNLTIPNTTTDIQAFTILKHTQEFTGFSHSILTDENGVGWNGWDKEGNVPVFCMINNDLTSDIFENEKDRIHFAKLSPKSYAKATIGHEMTHGIIDFTGYNHPLASQTRKELNEGICNIVGFAFSHWPSNFSISEAHWSYYWEYLQGPKTVHFWNPKAKGYPSAYFGDFYEQKDESEPGYRVHHNLAVMQYFFYLINKGKSGFVDDKPAKGAFTVEPLIPGNNEETFKLSLRILFNAFTQKLGNNDKATYPDLREATLQMTNDLGYGPESHVYRQIVRAWDAVDVKSEYNSKCITASAESLLNGTISFNAKETTVNPQPGSAKITQLVDCSSENHIETVEIDEVNAEDYQTFTSMDPVLNIYGRNNDPVKSKMAVSVHAHSGIARDWFRDKFGHTGMDGAGEISLLNALGNNINKEHEIWSSFKRLELKYDFSSIVACRDEIFRRYAGAVSICRDYPFNFDPEDGEEADILEAGLAGIFALEIKKDFERAKQNPAAEDIWTLYEEMEDATQILDFSQPKLHGQPSVYHGANWLPNNAKHNAGFLQLFYYLLVHGTEGAEGYTNDEPGSLTYFVNKIPRELALRVLWNASRTVSYDPTIEEFRMATLSELHKLDPVKYHAKSKEHIAFYDAWAAVLGLPDYASTLAHFPEDDAVVYPWAAKVGVEAEYPQYESYRLFEVSTSMAFNDNVAPVYRFVNSSAPDLATGMTYGYINLEPGKYFVRSHLAQGPDSRAHCEASDDPAFCESLLGKEKWTLPYPFTAGPVPAPVTISPLKGETVPAWSSFFSFGSVAGAMGYDMHVKDPQGTAAEHTIAVDIPYDEDDQSSVTKKLALSAKKPYSYAVAGKQKLGSEKAVHVLPGGLLQLLTEAEKEQFPTIYSDWTEEVSFETDMPTITLKSPADQDSIPLFGEDVVLRSTRLSPDVADYYQFYLKEPFYESPANAEEVGSARFAIHVPGLQGVEDKKAYHWAIVPRKKPEPPFIVEEEEGEVAKWHQFIVTKNLAPKPEVDNIDCVEAGSEPVLHWKPVAGAQTYKLTGVNGTTQAELGSYQTGQLGGKLANMSTFPNKYIYKVAAGVMGGNGEWIFGPEAVGDYSITPPSPTNLTPNNVSGVPLQEGNSVLLSWDMPAGVTRVGLVARDENTQKSLAGFMVNGNQITLENLEFDHDISWALQAESPDQACLSKAVTASFQTEAEPEKENKPINSDLAFTLEELSTDDFDMIIRTPSGYTFTFTDSDKYVQDTQDGTGPDIAFFTDPEEGLYEVSVRIFSINSNKCPAFFTIKALEDGDEKAVIGNNIQVPCNIYFVGAEIGQVVNGQVTTFKYTYTK